MLERYNAAIPNGADRIMKMAEEQAKHRQALENTVINGNVAAQAHGQIGAVVVVVTGLICGTVLIALDKPVGGFVTIIGSLTTMAGVFLYARRAQERERRERLSRQNAAATD
jgi:uncharacterized membrane protein